MRGRLRHMLGREFLHGGHIGRAVQLFVRLYSQGAGRVAEIVERPRAFVRCDGYFGPDRRRHRAENYGGPWRRAEDFEDMDVR